MPKAPTDLASLPKLDELKVHLQWSKDWWDGPMNGVATYDGLRCWFEFHSMDEEGLIYFYLLHPLSPEEQRIVEEWHSANEKWRLVWMERYTTDNRYSNPECKAFAADWRREVPELRLPALDRPLGWFSSGRNSSFYGVQITKPA